MLNQVIMVGRLTKDPEVKEEKAYITLAIPRSFKNADGAYDTDFINCVLFNDIATNTAEYCRKGDIVGVKGRLQSNDETDYKIEVIAEKVTFLTSKRD